MTTIDLNTAWRFKLTDAIPTTAADIDDSFEEVLIPHTWNAYDGQDGGEDYYRGQGVYVTELSKDDFPSDEQFFVKFEGANSVAEVFVNGDKVKEHRGGYSAFIVDISEALNTDDITLAVRVDNRHYDDIYPQVADFTFYGGLYRKVSLIAVPKTHFTITEMAEPAITYTTEAINDDGSATIAFKANIANPGERDLLHLAVKDEDATTVAEFTVPAQTHHEFSLFIPDAKLWQSTNDPYLYIVEAEIIRGNDPIDTFRDHLGIRQYLVDPEKGFFLNGKSFPLRGVSRHQDRKDKGNALDMMDMIEDVDLIKEIGANTARLAHYQQNDDFYTLSDIYGFVVWAEIPFISIMNKDPKAHENAKEQLVELIKQNYNHPSIMFWGISNEITIGGDIDGLEENLVELNELAHSLDDTRLTTMAQVTMLPTDSNHNQITDVVSYNHYFGWYGGDFDQNDVWFDQFHQDYPERAIGISEYGCEGIINWHSDQPVNQDYTEEYQTAYHEHMAQMIADRPYLWATHVWNMFDFGADNRDEGGVSGRNNKGLVSFDRSIKKDAFYVYKAYWSNDPFVHIAEKRFAQRDKADFTLKVYSNCDEVTLYQDGKKIQTLEKSETPIFKFTGLTLNPNKLTAFTVRTNDDNTDTATFQLVNELPTAYQKPAEEEQEDGAKNWFDDLNTQKIAPDYTFDSAHYSIKDTVETILQNKEASDRMLSVASAKSGMNVKASTLQMMNQIPIENLESLFGKATDDNNELKWLNAELQQIKK